MSDPAHMAPEEALEEMDSCIRVSRAYQRAGERCAELDPEMVKRWRGALVRAMQAGQAAAPQTSSQES